MSWSADLESYTEHARSVFDRQGQRLHEDGILKSTPVEQIPDDDVRGVVKAINDGTSSDGSQLPAWFVPGFGDSPGEEPDLYRERCGRDIPWGCVDCARPVEIGDTCRISRCPRCAAAWALKNSYSPIANLMLTRYLRDQAQENHVRLHHVVVSPKPGELFDVELEDDEDPMKAVAEKGMEIVRDALAELGIEDFHAFYHAWRGKKEHDLEAGAEEVADITSLWKNWLFQGEDSESFNSLRDRELEFSPHFHVIAVANEVPGQGITKAIEAATGWVIHRIVPNGSNVSLYDYKDLARAVTYCISHTSLYLGPDDKWHSMNRAFGMVKSAKPSDKTYEWARDLARRPDVAGATLGIEPGSLECSGPTRGYIKKVRGGPLQEDEADDVDDSSPVTNVVESTTQTARTSPAAATRTKPGELPGEGSTWSSPGAQGADEPGAADEEDVDEMVDQGHGGQWDPRSDPEGRCGGRMKPVFELNSYLDDREWREQAPHLDDLLEMIEEYAETDERIEPPDVDAPG